MKDEHYETMDERRPWECMEDESLDEYRGFLCWRDLTGSRTLVRAYRQYCGNRYADHASENFYRWKAQNEWVKRALDWDRYQQRRKDEAHITAREEIASQRGKSLADFETRQIELAYDVVETIHEKLLQEEFQNSIAPQQFAPIMRALNETFKTLATFRNLRDESGAKTTPAAPLDDEKLKILFEDFEYELEQELEEEREGE